MFVLPPLLEKKAIGRVFKSNSVSMYHLFLKDVASIKKDEDDNALFSQIFGHRPDADGSELNLWNDHHTMMLNYDPDEECWFKI